MQWIGCANARLSDHGSWVAAVNFIVNFIVATVDSVIGLVVVLGRLQNDVTIESDKNQATDHHKERLSTADAEV